MAVNKYPSSSKLIFTFLEDVRRHRINSISGLNPSLINVDGEQMYVYIKNLSSAQMSNDNPDIWRIQLPKRPEFEDIKGSKKMFVLLGYDYIRKVYTSWNPDKCKLRLNVAESCSMYSRLSLQMRVAKTLKIEKVSLQNDGDVVCIPSSLIATYLKNIRSYYPEETTFLAQDSSNEELFNAFIECYKPDDVRAYLLSQGFQKNTVIFWMNRLAFAFRDSSNNLIHFKKEFIQCAHLRDYVPVINRYSWQPRFRVFDGDWRLAMQAALKVFLKYAEKTIYGTQDVRIRLTQKQQTIGEEPPITPQENENTSSVEKEVNMSALEYELDEFGKLKELAPSVIEQLRPMVKGIDYPDWEEVIHRIVKYYPAVATENMNPVDWMKLLDRTNWQGKRNRKTEQAEGGAERTALRITQSDGSIIQLKNSARTYVYAIENNYPDLILEMKFGRQVISLTPFVESDGTRRVQDKIAGGYYVNTKVNNETKVRILRKISDELGLNWIVELIPKE